MITRVGTLTDEDLGRWRMAQARLHAIQRKPGAYSGPDIEQAYITGARLVGDFCDRYGIDDAKNWVISCHTGVIYYND